MLTSIAKHLQRFVARHGLALGLAALIVGGASSAWAGGCTGGVLCGRVVNESAHAVWVANNWCWPKETEHSIEWLPCAAERAVAGGKDSNRYFRDTDAFQARAGCVTEYAINGIRGREDRRKRGSRWVRIRNHQTATVLRVSC